MNCWSCWFLRREVGVGRTVVPPPCLGVHLMSSTECGCGSSLACLCSLEICRFTCGQDDRTVLTLWVRQQLPQPPRQRQQLPQPPQPPVAAGTSPIRRFGWRSPHACGVGWRGWAGESEWLIATLRIRFLCVMCVLIYIYIYIYIYICVYVFYVYPPLCPFIV